MKFLFIASLLLISCGGSVPVEVDAGESPFPSEVKVTTPAFAEPPGCIALTCSDDVAVFAVSSRNDDMQRLEVPKETRRTFCSVPLADHIIVAGYQWGVRCIIEHLPSGAKGP